MHGTLPAPRAVARCLLALFAVLALAGPAAAAPAPTFDHGAFDDLLATHVDAAGDVEYDGFAASASFEAYLVALANADLGPLPAPERLALWINAYNAYTIRLINRHGERKSIRNINRALGILAGKGPWSEPIARVAGRTYTLDQIEHQIIRPRFGEPRIHFALVCAARGCPPLRREAYTGARLDAQLDDQARAFLLRSPTKNRVEAARGVVRLSPIFRWYREDFGSDDRALLGYLARFFPPGPERDLLRAGRARVEHTEYDWSLNSRR